METSHTSRSFHPSSVCKWPTRRRAGALKLELSRVNMALSGDREGECKEERVSLSWSSFCRFYVQQLEDYSEDG